MTIHEKRLQAIYRQEPELKGLDYTVAKTRFVVSSESWSGSQDAAEKERWVYTFFAGEKGEDRFEIKVTVDSNGNILKFITSK